MAKIATKGILLQQYVASAFVTVAQRLKLSGPSAQMGAMEVTDLDSAMELRLPTLLNPGTVGGTLWYDPNATTHLYFTTHILDGLQAQWKLVYPDGMTTPSHHIFTGFITKFEPTGMEIKSYLQAEFEITLDGTTFTFTAGV